MTSETNDLREKIIAGVSAGSLEAIAVARRTNTKLVIWRDGKILEVTPDEWLALAEADAEKTGEHD